MLFEHNPIFERSLAELSQWLWLAVTVHCAGDLPTTKVHSWRCYSVWCGARRAGGPLAPLCRVLPDTDAQVPGQSGSSWPELWARLLRGVQVQVLALRGLGGGAGGWQTSHLQGKTRLSSLYWPRRVLGSSAGESLCQGNWSDDQPRFNEEINISDGQLYGCYEALHSGFTTKALQDLTGGIVQSFSLTSQDRLLTYQVNIYKHETFLPTNCLH